MRWIAAVTAMALLTSCAQGDDEAGRQRVVPSTSSPATAVTSEAPPGSTTTTAVYLVAQPDLDTLPFQTSAEVVELRYRILVRAVEIDADAVAAVIAATLDDPRGWSGAGFRFVPDAAGPFELVIAEPPEADSRCAPMQTSGRWSCQNGAVVVFNAERWRSGSAWGSDIDSYRQYLVNHEVGHLVGLNHPAQFCAKPGEAAAVMAQQSQGLGGCTSTVWPLSEEVALAATRPAYIAPPPRWRRQP